MKKILVVFGTRPEAIKMSPIVKALQREIYIDTRVCVTAQHREMLDQVLEIFDIKPDYDLNIMQKEQSLYDITTKIISNIKEILRDFRPDIVLVHGDTTTTFATSLSAFYQQIKIGHIEAGLRTNNIYSPWPEEANRQLTGILTDFHFAPTLSAKTNLLKENKREQNIVVIGNTVIDALFLTLKKINNNLKLKSKIIDALKTQYPLINNKRFILVTGHRRENFGDGFIDICKALKELALNNPEIDIIYPVHLNPNVQKPVKRFLSNMENIYLINPLQYGEFIYLMDKSYLIITDSGGIQEEAPALGKPVLVMRENSERPEAIEAGTVKLVGTNFKKIVDNTQNLLDNPYEYQKMSQAHNPYGDGKASGRVIKFLKETL